MRNLLRSKQGIFYTAVIIVVVMFVMDISYLAVALTTNKFFDMWDLTVTNNVYMDNLETVSRNVGPIVVVILNVGLIILLVASAWKRGSNEVPEELLG
jgi:uncharacterized membrane protein YjgN (DUF898 family)